MDKSDKTFADLRRKARESAPTRWSRKELAQIALLKGAHQESIAPLLSDCPVRVLARGEVLLSAGQTCEAALLVLSGRLRLEGPSSTIPDTMVKAGDSIGELFLREKVVVASTISAVEPTRLLVINRTTAWALIRKSPEIADNWMPLFAERRRASSKVAGSEQLKTSPLPQTTNDERTGLQNRHWLNSMLPNQIASSSAGKEPLGLLLVEIDGFADYVARFGKGAGDRAYQAAAQTIVNCVRPSDLVVCYDAARFAIVLLNCNATSACLVGERVRSVVSRAGALRADQSALHSLTVSVGATEFQPSTDASTFLAAAEAALQLATTRGGDRVAMQ